MLQVIDDRVCAGMDITGAVGLTSGQRTALKLMGAIDKAEARNALLGVIPLEALGIELDLRKQKLKLLPEESVDTYLTIL